MIGVENLTVTFRTAGGGVHAVREATFAVEQGGAFGLVGESGSGKSTVLRAIAALVPIAGGIVRIAGERMGRRRSKAQRRLMQLVFQDPYGSLHPRHTVDRMLSEPLAIHGFADAEERIRRALAEVGLGNEHRFRYPHQLSGGQRQRVAIARALILEPRILLLDEPTSALDVSVQAEILNLLQRLRREHRLTLLMVSHDLAVVAHMCDRLAVMNNGRILETLAVEGLREGVAGHPYTRQLLRASGGYDRALVDDLAVYA